MKWRLFKISYYVYRFLNFNNEIIYVGKTRNLYTRIKGHKHLPYSAYRETCKVEYTTFETYDDMEFAEKYYIIRFNPEYCIAHGNKRLSLSFSTLENKEWKPLNITTSWTKEMDIEIEKLKEKRKSNKELIKELKKEFAQNPNAKKIIRYYDGLYRVLEYCESHSLERILSDIEKGNKKINQLIKGAHRILNEQKMQEA